MSITQQQAYEMAVKLKAQGLTWPKIAEQVAAAGYKSARTGKPIGHLMVRHMVTAVEKKNKVVAKADKKEDAIRVKAVDNTLMEDVKKLLNAGVSPQMQKQILKWAAEQIS